MNLYEQLGIRTIINARGCITPLGGSIMPDEVIRAMSDAAPYYVNIAELNRKVGAFIAEVTGAEAGYVTSGGSAAALLSTAALIAGKDPGKIHKLPQTDGMINEIIVQRSHRHGYDHAVLAAGGKFVEIGHAYRTLSWQLEAAINEKTAGVFVTMHPFIKRGFLDFPEVIRIAHANNIPVYVDAASSLPPATNLQKFIQQGADLVFFSGGKAIMGPQGSGFVCGRKDLIKAIELNGFPNTGIGRSAKVSKEAMIGLMTALKLYIERDHRADQILWMNQCKYIAASISEKDFPGVDARIVFEETEDPFPEVHIWVNADELGVNPRVIDQAMYDGEPCIATGLPLNPNAVVITPHMLIKGQEIIIAKRLVETIEGLLKSQN
jgi:L-seryl-tRNA(Ser) seleniumtransferase